MSTIPINHKVLGWARNYRKLTLEEAAEHLEITPDDLRAYEDGTRPVNLGFLKKMAKEYNLPVATLAMPEPLPQIPSLKDFRTFEGRPATISHETAVVIDRVRSHVEFITDLLEENPDLFHSPHLPNIKFTKSEITEFARTERSRLGVTVGVQLQQWKDYLDAFRQLRRRIEKLGIFVHLLKMHKDDCRGFSILHSNRISIPVIVVNDREETYQAKTFTLFHEYAHLLLRKTGICDENRGHAIERFCNLFAAYFLMPREILAKVLDLSSGISREWEYTEIADAAKRIKVSQEALVIHLEDLGVAPVGFYARWKEGLPKKVTTKATGGRTTYAERCVRSLGVEYTGLVLKALDKSKINRVDAFEMLQLKPRHFSEVREVLHKFA